MVYCLSKLYALNEVHFREILLYLILDVIIHIPYLIQFNLHKIWARRGPKKSAQVTEILSYELSSRYGVSIVQYLYFSSVSPFTDWALVPFAWNLKVGIFVSWPPCTLIHFLQMWTNARQQIMDVTPWQRVSTRLVLDCARVRKDLRGLEPGVSVSVRR